jgi:serine/threonine-protein kinase HipA
MSQLAVHLHGFRVGTLTRLPRGRLTFVYEDGWVADGDLALSHSLPIRPEEFEDEDVRPFFSGLLPEGEFLRAVAREFGVSEGNPFSLLEAVGGECAGAVSLGAMDSEAPAGGPPAWLDTRGLRSLILRLPDEPLPRIEGGDGIRLSLAGAQNKLPVLFEGGSIGVTRGAPPSSHIVKLPREGLAGMVANEAFCLLLARKCGLDAVVAQPRVASVGIQDEPDDPEYLLVERYDRQMAEGAGRRRIHQEDFCQALGFLPELKYESDGGPGVSQCASLIREVSSAPARDLLAFGDALILNFLIGNNDAHSKNFSFLLEGDDSPRLSPLYDLMSTSVYRQTSRKMAMKLGGEYRREWVRRRHLERAADDLGFSPSSYMARAHALAERVKANLESASTEIEASTLSTEPLQAVKTEVVKGLTLLSSIEAEAT